MSAQTWQYSEAYSSISLVLGWNWLPESLRVRMELCCCKHHCCCPWFTSHLWLQQMLLLFGQWELCKPTFLFLVTNNKVKPAEADLFLFVKYKWLSINMTTCATSSCFFVVLISLFVNNIIRAIKYILIFSILKQGGFKIVHMEFQMKCRSHFQIPVFFTLFFFRKQSRSHYIFQQAALYTLKGIL